MVYCIYMLWGVILQCADLQGLDMTHLTIILDHTRIIVQCNP